MTFIFLYIGNVISPIDELLLFRGVDTTNQMVMESMKKLCSG